MRRERGMVTVELAMGLLAAALAVTVSCWVVSLVVVQARCEEVASQVARQLARGDDKSADEAKKRVPEGGRVTVAKESKQVVVEVRTTSSWGPIGPVQLGGRAVADLEPGATR